MAARADLLSSMSEMPTFRPAVQETDRNIITRNQDGTISIRPKEPGAGYAEDEEEVSHSQAPPKKWNENLAKKLGPTERMHIADDLIDFYETDIRVREKHFERMGDALELLGLTDIPDSDAPFRGAATITHPLIGEACTQFQSRAMEELFPPSGPVKPYIVGKSSEKKEQQGDRLADYLNYQLTEADEEYYWSVDQMLFYLPLAGSAFRKCCLDPITGMTTSIFVKAEDFVIPYYARSLQTAPRYCHRYEMTGNDVKRAQEKGTFISGARLVDSPNVALDRASENFGRGNIEDIADDRMATVHEDDVVYTMLEYHIDYSMPWDNEDDIAPPYIVTVEKESREVMSVRRNWKYDDDTKRKRIWFVHYKYLPGLGFYGFGLLHIIGSLAKAVSGAIRALLDSAAVANLSGGFRSKDLKISGELRFEPGVWEPVDCSIEDLSKGFFNIPAKEPSPALAKLTEELIAEGRRFATITENMVGDADNRGPVGTTLALIEQGSKVFSGIHKRMHKAARQEFKMLATLNYEFMDVDEYPYEVQGEERTILRSDFDGRVDVIPVSDPNIWSQTQRIALMQAGMELMKADPDLYPRKARVKMHQRMYKALRFPGWEDILPDLEDQNTDPVTENMDFLVGRATKVFPQQDHAAHIAIHMNFAQQQAADNPDLYKNIDPAVQAHIMEHRAYAYREMVEQQLGIKLPFIDLDDDETREEMPENVERQISAAVARTLKPVQPNAQQQQAAQEILDEAAAKDQARDIETIGKLQARAAETAAKIKSDREAFEEKQRQEREAFDAEQRRKQEEHRLEMQQERRAGNQEIDIARRKSQATFRPPPKKKKARGRKS